MQIRTVSMGKPDFLESIRYGIKNTTAPFLTLIF